MNNFLNKFQKIMTAATFAEAGEWDTAREMTPDTELSREPTWLNRIFMAAAFAESGLQGDAIRFLEPQKVQGNRGFNAAIAQSLGLQGVHVMYGTVRI